MNDELRQAAVPILLVGCGQMGRYYTGCFFGQLGFKEGDVIAYDRDPKRRIEFTEKFPLALTVGSMEAALELRPKTAFVLVNSPEHLPVIHRLLDVGITNILVEKPLVLTSQLDDLLKHPRIAEANLVTAYLISFSLAVQRLMDFMKEHGLVVVEARGLWGKNRIGNDRPTAGDWEDEATHPFCTISQLIAFNQIIHGLDVSARFSRLPYVNKAVQHQVIQHDPSYEENPIATSCVGIDFLTRHGMVLVAIQSSFVSMELERQVERRVEVALARRDDDSRQIAYLARIDFDVAKEDYMRVWDVAAKQDITKEVCPEPLDKDVKLPYQIVAFLEFLRNSQKDPRLVDLRDTVGLIRIGEAALQSHQQRQVIPLR